jgi:hypothetical protein
MFSEEDGDSLVGRTVTQLKFTADEFDILCPHFGPETLETLYNFGWDNILPGYRNIEMYSISRVIPYLLSDFAYHYFKGDVHRLYPYEDHPIWAQPILTNRRLLNSLREKIIFCHSYCEETMMSAQGVPAFITISREIRLFKAYYESTCNETSQHVITLKEEIHQLFNELPQMIVNTLLEQVRVDGAVPISIDSIRRLISEMLLTGSNNNDGPLSQIRNSILELRQELNGGGQNNREGVTNNTNHNNIQNNNNNYNPNAGSTVQLHYWRNSGN